MNFATQQAIANLNKKTDANDAKFNEKFEFMHSMFKTFLNLRFLVLPKSKFFQVSPSSFLKFKFFILPMGQLTRAKQ